MTEVNAAVITITTMFVVFTVGFICGALSNRAAFEIGRQIGHMEEAEETKRRG